jgi:hypothetical protein
MSMGLEPSDLLPGERKLMTKGANLIVSVKEAGLSRFIGDKYMWVTGMQGKEAIGGLVHLTNYRLIFKSHFMNRLRGSHSIFLPNITSITKGFNRLHIDTEIQQFTFVIWFWTAFIENTQKAANSFSPEGVATLQNLVTTHPEIIGLGLQKWATLEVLNQIASAGLKVHEVVHKLSGTDKNTFLEFLSLMQK